MVIKNRRIYHINDVVGSINNGQFCYEPLEDPDLHFRMFAYKTDDGDEYKCLAKDQDARINDLRCLGDSFQGSASYLMHSTTGIVTGGHVPVTTISLMGQTAYGGAWRISEGNNITINQDSENRILTINGAVGGGGYDDTPVFYKSGSRLATGNFDMDSHHIEGLTGIRGDVDNDTTALQRIVFDTGGDVVIDSSFLDDAHKKAYVSVLGASGGASLIARVEQDATTVIDQFGIDSDGIYWKDRNNISSSHWNTEFHLSALEGELQTNPWDRLYAALGDSTNHLVGILADLAGGILGVKSVSIPSQLDPPYKGDVSIIPGLGMQANFIEGVNGFQLENVGVTAQKVNGTDSTTGIIDWVIGDHLVASRLTAGNGWRLDAVLGEVILHPSAISTTHGTPTGSLSDILEFADGTSYEIHEVSGVPGIEATITFSDVVAFSEVQLYALYTGSGPQHHLDVELWSNNADAWVQIGTIVLGASYELFTYEIPVSGPFISETGEVLLHINHPQTGNTSHEAFIGYCALVRDGIPSSAISLQLAYDGGRSITTVQPVAMTSSTDAPTAVIGNADPDNTSEVLQIYNVSDSEGPSIGLYGQAGIANNFGHEIRTDTTASLRTSFTAYNDTTNEAIVAVKKESFGEGAYVRSAVHLESENSNLSDSAVLELIASYAQPGVGPSTSTAELSAHTVTIESKNGGDINLEAGTGSVDLSDSVCQNAKNLSFSDPETPSGTTTLSVDAANGSPYHNKAIAANVTAVNINAPYGPQEFYIRITTDGTARTVTGFADGAVPINWGCTVNPNASAYTIAANSWAQFRFSYWGPSIGYTAWVVEPAP